MTDWFAARYGTPTPAQTAAWPHIAAGRHTLIVSPTGTGKTLAAFLAILHDLADLTDRQPLPETIYALYISPLRALSYDLEKNLRGPLHEIYGEPTPIRIGLRTGDTPAATRQHQLAHPPHLLLTTPESLCLLLSQPKWRPALATVRWVVVDEIHALAENKRGSHLTLSLERLAHDTASSLSQAANVAPDPASATRTVRPDGPQRIGLSATVAPRDEIAAFLGGVGRPVEIVDVTHTKQVELTVFSPLTREPYPAAGFSGVRMIRELGRLVRAHATTLVFTNTRSGAESATLWLRETLPDLADRIECHHASLDRDIRLEVEDRLKRGELRAVVCSTSLELGIDIGAIDLVVMLAAPKGVTKALQRTGRAGHDIRRVSRGLLMATNVHDLVECCATARLARVRHLDPVRFPEAPLDVLAQHLAGMGCVRRWSRSEAFELVRRAHPYRDLAQSAFDDVLEYLAGGGRALRAQYTDVFGKLALDDTGFETLGGRVRRDFLQNVGVIPNEGVVTVRLGGRNLGTVEEGFLRGLQPGDVFTLGGRPVRLERVGVMEAFVARADNARPTVPRWNANKFPLSNRVASEIVAFRSELRPRLEAGEPEAETIDWIRTRLACGSNNARLIHRLHAAQQRVSEIPTADALLVEEIVTHDEIPATATAVEPVAPATAPIAASPVETRRARQPLRPRARPQPAPGPARHYFFHSLIGRAANDALSRVVALRHSRLRGGNALATPDDYGFVLTVAPTPPLSEPEIRALLDPTGFLADLEVALARSQLLKYHFRNAAQAGLMVYRNYFGNQKPVRKLQFSTEVIFNVLVQHDPDHVLLREARRDASHAFLDTDGAVRFLEAQARQPLRLRSLPRVPPLSFGMYATRIREALLVEHPAETLERLFHDWWAQIEHDPGPPRA